MLCVTWRYVAFSAKWARENRHIDNLVKFGCFPVIGWWVWQRRVLKIVHWYRAVFLGDYILSLSSERELVRSIVAVRTRITITLENVGRRRFSLDFFGFLCCWFKLWWFGFSWLGLRLCLRLRLSLRSTWLLTWVILRTWGWSDCFSFDHSIFKLFIFNKIQKNDF